ncbi:MAG: adenylyl-sulfate kinase [Elusimicrobiota bacterium]|nr:adenylyl-sulfate kinase [Elusimicrobiota bacterium]
MNNQSKTGFVLWFTGLPCSGKTTVAVRVARELKQRGLNIERLDGDIVRESLTSDLGFSKKDRNENIERIAFLSKLLSRNGVGVIAAFVSPYKEIRKKVRESVTNFIEVFVDCPPSECEKRDVKGMYKLAREGKIDNFSGVSDPYEKPENPELTIHTHKETVSESVEKIIMYMAEHGFTKGKREK